MKKIILLSLLIITFSCKEKTSTSKTIVKETPVNFDWLIGNWERLNEEEGKQTFENWVKKSNGEYVGIGFTMKEKDTLSKENMSIFKTNNNQWDLKVKSVGKGGDDTPVTFKMTNFNTTSFTCENKEIDFPNTIHYAVDGKQLKASVSGGDMTIPFVFERLER